MFIVILFVTVSIAQYVAPTARIMSEKLIGKVADGNYNGLKRGILSVISVFSGRDREKSRNTIAVSGPRYEPRTF